MKNRQHRSRRRPCNPATESPVVDAYLQEVGFIPRMIADDFWDYLHARYGDHAKQFLRYVDQRASSERTTDGYVDSVEQLYRLKNASPDFSVAITSQYFGRLYTSYLAMVESCGLPRAVASVLDIGCDNGILTAFYAHHFRRAHVLGVDRCEEGLACATANQRRLGIHNLSFLATDALAASPPAQLKERKWDIVFMTLCGYEQLERDPDTERAVAARFMDFVKPGGKAIVVEYPTSRLLPEIQLLARDHETWTLNYEAFGGDQQQVVVSLLASWV